MTFADSGKAIGAVTRLLGTQLRLKTKELVSIGRPELQAGRSERALNLFLYEARLDGSMRNYPLDEGRKPPVWLVLRYMVTAFDAHESDTEPAHGLLGEGIRALQEMGYLSLENADPDVLKALGKNPEVLKVTFDDVSSETISRVMQGTSDRYRCSVGVQVRPVMIAADEEPEYGYLVGIDNTVQNGPAAIGTRGIGLEISGGFPGPAVEKIDPAALEPARANPPALPPRAVIGGSGFGVPDLAIYVGPVRVPALTVERDRITFETREDYFPGDAVSAGDQLLTLGWTTPGGRPRRSNAALCALVPRLDTAQYAGGQISLEGALLGRGADDPGAAGQPEDDTVVALSRAREKLWTFDRFLPAQDQNQTARVLDMTGIMNDPTLVKKPKGRYRVILRVNGQQARHSPEVDIP